MKDFFRACQRGTLMTRQTFLKWLQITLVLVGLTTIIGAPFGLALVENIVLKTVVWVFLLIVILIAAICVGLTPYWGQKEITKDVEQEKSQYEKWMWEARNEVERLKQEIAKLKQ